MTENETLKNIKRRRSVRNYKAEQIKDEELQAILEAGQYAPNAGGESWHFTVIQKREILDRLNLLAKEAAKKTNMEWLQKLGNDKSFNCLYGAPTLIIISGDERAPMPLDADCAAANQNMLVAAESLGIGSCWIYFVLMAFNSQEGPGLRKELGIPEGYRLYFSAVFGYKNSPDVSPPPRKPGTVTLVR